METINLDFDYLFFSSIQWEEIPNSVWCCPVKVKAAVKDSSSRTGLALALFGLFYPKEELGGRRLHELDQDIIEAITGVSTKVLSNENWLHLCLNVSLALPREILRGKNSGNKINFFSPGQSLIAPRLFILNSPFMKNSPINVR